MSDLVALCSEHLPFFIGSVFVLGLVIGSFLNVVIHRLPVMMERDWRAQAIELLASTDDPIGTAVAAATAHPEPLRPLSLSTPRSACPTCHAPIKAWQNIPIVSWLVLRGRCAACNVRISGRYPFVELATGVLSAWVAWHFGFTAAAACALPVTWTLIALAGIDIDTQLLPDGLTYSLLWAGLLASVWVGPQAGSALPVSVGNAILGAAAGYLSLWAVYHAYRLATGKIGMGHGDFKLFAALGAWLGWKMLPVVILLSSATGALFGIAMIVLRGRDRAVPISFGPYLAAAGWLAMLYGNSLLNAYLHLW